MKLINVVKKDDEILTRINGTIEEIAEHYFQDDEVVKIEILEDETFQNEYFKRTNLEIYRADDQSVKEFDLNYNIRFKARFDYFDGSKSIINDAGLIKIE